MNIYFVHSFEIEWEREIFVLPKNYLQLECQLPKWLPLWAMYNTRSTWQYHLLNSTYSNPALSREE